MRVDPSGTHRPLPATVPAKRPARPAAPAVGPSPGEFAPTADLTNLLAGVRHSPEVRAAVVEAVAARMAAGEFDSPEAAADAARVLLAGR